MKKMYAAPVVEEVTFDYKIMTTSSDEDCYYSVMNETDGGATSYTNCIGGTPVVFGWTDPQPVV